MKPDFVSFASAAAALPDAQAVQAAFDCLDRFTAAFNACDPGSMDAQLHFPHTMWSGAEQLVWLQPGQHPPDLFDRLRCEGWMCTHYERRDALLAASDKVHVLLRYTRRGADGKVISTHDNVWIVIRVQDRCAIAARSY